MIDMKGKTCLLDLTGYDILDKNQIFEFNSDIFIPAAMENVIIDKTVTKLLNHGVKIVIKAANLSNFIDSR